MSQEIKTPLNTIMSAARHLMDICPAGEPHEYARIILSAAEILSSMIDDAIDCSQPENDEFKLHENAFSLSGLIDKIIDVFIPEAHQKGLNLNRRVAGDLPATVRGDEKRIGQILFTYLHNAVNVTRSGQITLDVSWQHFDSDRIVVKFSIKGIGDDIFHRLESIPAGSHFQTKALTIQENSDKGSGLMTSRQLVDLMGGTTGYENSSNEGGVCWFTAVVDIVEDNHIFPIHVSPGDGDSPEKILIVDDNQFNQKLAAAILKKNGFDSYATNRFHDAIEALKTGEFAIILIDLKIPEMLGNELLKGVRRIRDTNSGVRNSDIPIIGLADSDEQIQQIRLLQTGIIDYIKKPFVPSVFNDTVSKYLNLSVDKSLPEHEHRSAGLTDIFDPDDLKTRLGDDGEVFSEILQEFPDFLIKQVNQLRENIDEKTFEAAQTCAHTIKGMAGNISAHQLANSAKRLETAFRNKEHRRIHQLFQELENSAESLLQLLNQMAFQDSGHHILSLSPSVSDADEAKIISTDVLKKLPEPWRIRFKDAVEAAEYQTALHLIEQIRSDYDGIATELTAHVKAYRFDVLQKLFDTGNPPANGNTLR